ncbi:MAG: hypothetical protein KIT48_06460 [Pseudolabrys sp.]|nr:hypothetical protein [Pseudolabrys sp.]
MSRMFALLLLSMLALAGGPTCAAEGSPFRLPPARPFVAPPDERQPTLQGLPQAIAHSEGRRTQRQKDLDKTLQICRGC